MDKNEIEERCELYTRWIMSESPHPTESVTVRPQKKAEEGRQIDDAPRRNEATLRKKRKKGHASCAHIAAESYSGIRNGFSCETNPRLWSCGDARSIFEILSRRVSNLGVKMKIVAWHADHPEPTSTNLVE